MHPEVAYPTERCMHEWMAHISVAALIMLDQNKGKQDDIMDRLDCNNNLLASTIFMHDLAASSYCNRGHEQVKMQDRQDICHFPAVIQEGTNAGNLTIAERQQQTIMIYQIPLVPQPVMRTSGDDGVAEKYGVGDAIVECSDVPQGDFYGLQNLKLVRDKNAPIRLTVQIYKVQPVLLMPSAAMHLHSLVAGLMLSVRICIIMVCMQRSWLLTCMSCQHMC